ncbi:hypothetical protein NKH18_33385 [Streptomyces sp. M10(2022)]
MKLSKSEAGGEATGDDVNVVVTSVNTADYQVTGADVKGSVGDTVTLKAKFANAGPAWVLTDEGTRSSRSFSLPAGTSFVKSEGYCDSRARRSSAAPARGGSMRAEERTTPSS